MSAEREPHASGLIGRVAGAVAGRVVDVVPADVILDSVDINALLDRMDPDRLLDRVDPDRLLARVDLNRLLARVDLNALLATVDLDALLRDVEVDELVRRAGIPGMIAQTTNALAGTTLDSVRRQLVGVDTILARLVDRLLRRQGPTEAGPAALVAGP